MPEIYLSKSFSSTPTILVDLTDINQYNLGQRFSLRLSRVAALSPFRSRQDALASVRGAHV